MGKNKYIDSSEFSETNNWNTARDYSSFMIFMALRDCILYEDLACFGTLNIEEEFFQKEEIKTQVRLKSMKRLLKKLQQIVDNCEFGLKEADKEPMLEFKKDLNFIETQLLPHIQIQTTKYDQVLTSIDEERFEEIFKECQRIRREMTNLMNNADMIYTSSEDFSLEKMEEAIKKEMQELG